MDLLEFFGLKEDPFKLIPDPKYFFSSASHKEALHSLSYVIEQREGFCLITGEPGTGKTTVLRVFMEIWKEKAEIALILTPRLSPEEFLVALLDDLSIKYDETSKTNMLKSFRDFLLEKSQQKMPVIIIVDEAQSLPDETIEELRLLSNLETEKEKLLQIILIGQPELEKRLNKGSLRQLKQRITVKVRLKPLVSSEILEYINYRLIKAGKGFLQLGEGLSKPIYEFSKGIPRIINLITSRSIMSAYLEKSSVITPKHVGYAIDHLEGDEVSPESKPRSKLYYGLAASLFIIITGAVVFYYFSYPGTRELDISPKPPNTVTSVPSEPPKQESGIERPDLPTKTEPPPVELIEPEDIYRHGRKVFLAGRFNEAAESFKDFVKRYPQHSLTDNALYWSGEAYYALGEYKNALVEFEKVVKEYPNGNKAPDALLMAGFAFIKLNNKQKAEEVLAYLIDRYPGTKSAKEAKEKLKNLKLSR